MESFLKSSKKYLERINDFKIVKIVIGNQSCDLDSAVCVIVYAFHYYNDSKYNKNVDHDYDDDDDDDDDDDNYLAVIPILNIKENEFRLKTEVIYFFKKHNIPIEFLTFRNQLNIDSILNNNDNKNKLELILVDHHDLKDSDKRLENFVTEIIDHRPQDPKWLWKGRNIKIEIVGSCATLIAKILFDKKSPILDNLICSLLTGPIIVDTANFSKIVNKATPLDFEMIEKLENFGSILYDREIFYKEILEAKTDISGLSAGDLLNKDMKLTNAGVPIAGLPILVEDFIKIEGCFDDLIEFTKLYPSKVTIVMGLSLGKNTVERDMAIFTLNGDKKRKFETKIIDSLNDCKDPPLKLKIIENIFKNDDDDNNDDKYNFVLLKIGNIEASRKQILPIIDRLSIDDCPC